MIDLRLLEKDFPAVSAQLSLRGVPRDQLERLVGLLDQRRRQVGERDDLRAYINSASKAIGQLMAAKQLVEADTKKQEVKDKKEALLHLEDTLRTLEEQIHQQHLELPNLPAPEAPRGTSEQDNVILRTHGYDPANYTQPYRPHWELAEQWGLLDLPRAAKTTGAMFTFYRGQGAKLIRALVHLGLSLNSERYTELIPPHFVRTETLTATGQLPKFAEDAYHLPADDLWAIPTAEVPLTSYYRDEILEFDQMPQCFMAYSVCFRREAGSAGKDTRGLQRLHEFHKVELLKFVRPEQALDEHQAMLGDVERMLQVLGLPYRVLDLCTGDLGNSAARTFDLEVYAPGVGRWLEVSSVSHFSDYQCRRGNVRYRDSQGKPQFAHTLNGSGLATPRIWAALIEQGQQPDGTILLPEILHEFMGTNRMGGDESCRRF
ncbi:serine--tRNA ligase [Candidatus Cyanaurora vandensis]|uniref:serine--tRNA ligase n=1 Tax=Candidatus Cyanaurora vandensis TaxID=2714958 RepID=UPI00257E0B23|nr:serine--tRNA ligase [Candidatus Cyanaurora vandensis]